MEQKESLKKIEDHIICMNNENTIYHQPRRKVMHVYKELGMNLKNYSRGFAGQSLKPVLQISQ